MQLNLLSQRLSHPQLVADSVSRVSTVTESEPAMDLCTLLRVIASLEGHLVQLTISPGQTAIGILAGPDQTGRWAIHRVDGEPTDFRVTRIQSVKMSDHLHIPELVYGLQMGSQGLN